MGLDCLAHITYEEMYEILKLDKDYNDYSVLTLGYLRIILKDFF